MANTIVAKVTAMFTSETEMSCIDGNSLPYRVDGGGTIADREPGLERYFFCSFLYVDIREGMQSEKGNRAVKTAVTGSNGVTPKVTACSVNESRPCSSKSIEETLPPVFPSCSWESSGWAGP
jgi:hypothetical protein